MGQAVKAAALNVVVACETPYGLQYVFTVFTADDETRDDSCGGGVAARSPSSFAVTQ